MNDLNYRLLKLSTGDNIICKLEENEESVFSKKIIKVIDPVVIASVRIPRGSLMVESYVLMPWVGFSESTDFKIPTSHILTISEITDNARKNYEEFVEQRKKNYLDDLVVEEELENNPLLQLLKKIKTENQNESQEENSNKFCVSGNRTIH